MSEEDTIVEEGLPRVSQMLVDARTRMGLSQKEVADQLFLTTSYIRHMDAGQFDRMPKPAFIKGYLRTYARTVELDGDVVVACYEEILQANQEQVEIRDVTEESVGSSRFTGPVIQTGIAALVALIVVILLVWVFSGSDDEPPVVTAGAVSMQDAKVETEMPVLKLPTRETLDESLAIDGSQAQTAAEPPATDAQSTETPVAKTTVTKAADKPVEKTVAKAPEKVAASKPEPQAKKVGVDRVVLEEGVLITVDAGGADKIELTFSDECWLEVEDADGDSIYGDLNRDGDTLVVMGRAPFEVLFGKATAANMVFNGEEVDLARYTTNDLTAKVTLTP